MIDLGLVGAVSSWHVVVRAGLRRQSMIGVGWWALLRLGCLSIASFSQVGDGHGCLDIAGTIR